MKCYNQRIFHTGGMVRWLKKSSKDVNNTCSKYIPRVFLPKWLTFFSSKKPRWLKIRIILPRIQFLSEPHRQKDTWSIFWRENKGKWMVRILSHLGFKCLCCHVLLTSFDDFLSHLTIPPYCCRKGWSFHKTWRRKFLCKYHDQLSVTSLSTIIYLSNY